MRALWAGAPLVWNIYPQADGAHRAKLQAFLDWLDAPASMRHFHGVWNGLQAGPLPQIDAADLALWGECVKGARQRLLAQESPTSFKPITLEAVSEQVEKG